MDARTALRYAALYHALALAATLVAAVVAGVGLYAGLRGSLAAASLTDPGSLLGAAGTTGLVVAALGVVAGVYIRRVGHTAARIHVGTRALDEGLSMPSTSVIARKVGREVSEEVSKYVGDGDAAAGGTASGGDAGFELDDTGESGGAGDGSDPADEAAGAALD